MYYIFKQQLFREALLESIKVIALICDLMNGIIYEIGNLALTNARINGILAFVIPEVVFIVFIVLTATLITKAFVKLNCNGPCEIIICTIIILSSSIGLILYLIFDNYYIIEQIQQDQYLIALNDTDEMEDIHGRINAIQPSLLLLAILFFKGIPKVFKKILTWYGDTNSETEDAYDYDDLNKSIWIGMFNVLTLTTEFDAWFTLIQHFNDCSIQVYLVWVLWICMVCLFLFFLICVFSCTIGRCWDDYDKWAVVVSIPLIICIVTTFSLYLLGDNRQPLDCYDTLTEGFDGKLRSGIKLLFLSIAFVSYTCILTLFFIIICCMLHDIPHKEDKKNSKDTIELKRLKKTKLNY